MKADKLAYFYVFIVLLGWGLSIFFDKLATNKLGNKSITPVAFSLIASILVLAIFLFFSKRLGYDQRGLMAMIAATFVNSIGIIAYYLLIIRTEITWAVPVTALYPIIPIVLGIIVLHETLSITKIAGIILSLGAIIFLSL